MLPATWTGILASRRMCPISDVVVVLPFVPVTPITRPRNSPAASSSSPAVCTPHLRARTIAGKSHGTPGEGTMRSCDCSNVSECSPRCTLTGKPSRAASAAANS